MMIKKNYKNFGLLFIFLSMMISSTAYLYHINSPRQDDNVVVDGYLDLSDYNLKEVVLLDGDWAYYPNVFIDPNEDIEHYEASKSLIHVPQSFLTSSTHASDYGTYHLKIKVADGPYAIKLRTVRYAYDVYMNGTLASSLGVLSDNIEESLRDSQFKVGFGIAEDNELDILMHVSKSNFDSTGILSSIQFGDKDLIVSKNIQSKLIEFSFVVILITLGSYYILTYINRKDSIFLVYFGLMSISSALILSLMSEQVLRDLFTLTYIERSVLQMIIFWIFVASAHYFVSKLYHQWSNDKITNIINVYLLAVELIFFYLFFTKNIFVAAKLQYIMVLGLVFAIVHIIYIMVKAYINEATGYFYSSVVMLMVIDYIFLMIAKVFYSIDLGYSQQIYFTFIIIGSILLFNEFYNNDYLFAKELGRSVEINRQNRDSFFRTLINNVVTPLKSNVKEVEEMMGDKSFQLNRGASTKFNEIRNQTQEIIYMIEDINVLMGGEKPKVETFENVKLNQVINEGVAIFIAANDIENRQIVNTFDIDVDVNLDVSSFSTVFYQLLRNALQNTKKDGTISVRGSIIDRLVYLYIEDNGKGISKQDLPYIFDAFYKTPDSKSESFGLGLTLAKETIENHDGIITLTSTKDVGTRISIGLPISNEAHKITSSSKQKEINTAPFDQDFNLMVVSDNKEIESKLDKVYDSLTIHSFKANGIEQLKEKIIQQKIDVLVLDYNNPLLLQEAVVKDLRDHFASHKLPILIIAQQQILLDMWFHQQMNANDFISSPIEYHNLVLKINNLYSSKEAVQKGVEKEFKYLYAQISPHFLYNTLNTIIGLSYIDVDKSREGLQNLAVYLRDKMDIFDAELLITMEQELEIIESYLSIEKLRFGDNIHIEIDAKTDLSFKVPSLLIQNLVENSFKHAFNLSESHNEIKILITQDDLNHIITIKDNGGGMDDETIQSVFDKKTSGFGYRNTLERLSLIEGSDMKIKSVINEGTTTLVKIPKEIL